MKISGEVAVVMGAAREGIGKGYCKALLDKGAKVLPAGVTQNDVIAWKHFPY